MTTLATIGEVTGLKGTSKNRGRPLAESRTVPTAGHCGGNVWAKISPQTQ
ncbi:MAG: hypothetical protein HRT36_01745 [Alphaproteobacteria bacterium]|nr:hypothetical protein [Alphaproteobacteria bacterium]